MIFIKDGGVSLERKYSLILTPITKPSEGDLSSCPCSKDTYMQLSETGMAQRYFPSAPQGCSKKPCTDGG